jgi:hypothetical protein
METFGLDGPGSISDSQDFSLLHSVQTGSEAHRTSYPIRAWDSFPGDKAAGA